MSIEIRPPGEGDIAATFTADARAFGFAYSPEEIADQLTVMDLSRFRIAVDDGEVVGIVGSYAMEVTLPGGATLPMAAVTWVSVSSTHRRRGLLRDLMAACHTDVDARGEPVAMLFASEGGIYERFGYATATSYRYTTIDPRTAQLRPEFVPPPGATRFVEGERAAAHVAQTWERYRTMRAGEVRRSIDWNALTFLRRGKPESGLTAGIYLAHADGYAVYRLSSDWALGQPSNRLELVELVAITPEAHAALWHTLLGVDLVATITSRQIPVDDPLPYLLTNPRALRTVAVNDGVWCNVRNVARCFESRTYSTTDRLVVEVGATRYSIDGSPTGATVRRVRARADLFTDEATLGALLLGGVSATRLVAGGRMRAREADVLRRAESFFNWPIAPGSQTYY